MIKLISILFGYKKDIVDKMRKKLRNELYRLFKEEPDEVLVLMSSLCYNICKNNGTTQLQLENDKAYFCLLTEQNDIAEVKKIVESFNLIKE